MKLLLDRIFVLLVLLITCEGLDKKIKNKTHVQSDNILEDFHAISNHLHNIKMVIKNKKSLSTKSDSILDPPKICILTEDSLYRLKDMVDLSMLPVRASQSYSNCKYNNNPEVHSCSVLLKLIQCGIHKIKDKFFEAMNKPTKEEHIAKWKNAINDLKARHQEEMENLNLRIRQMERKQLDTVMNTQILATKLCLFELANGGAQSAADLFLKFLKSDPELKQIIITSYNDYGGFARVADIAIFLNNLPSDDRKDNALMVLFDIVKKNDMVSNPEILMLDVVSQQCSNASGIQELLKPYVDEMVNIWVNNIRQKDLKWILNATSAHPNFYGHYIDHIVKKSFDKNPKHGMNVMHFIGSLEILWHRIIGFKSFYREIKNIDGLDSYNLVLLAINVKSTMMHPNYGAVSIHYRDQLTLIKNKLPAAVFELVWDGKSCTIRNKWSNEPMYARGYDPYNEDSRYVFTWIPPEKNPRWNDTLWKFEFHKNKRAFSLKNFGQSEYLFSMSTLRDNDKKCHRRRVFTWIKKGIIPDAYWFIIPASNGTYFKLRNILYKEYLYLLEQSDGCSDGIFNAQRRIVFSKGPCDSKHCEWKIEC